MVYVKTSRPAVDEAVGQSGKDNALDTTTVVPLQDPGRARARGDDAEGAEHGAKSTPRVRRSTPRRAAWTPMCGWTRPIW